MDWPKELYYLTIAASQSRNMMNECDSTDPQVEAEVTNWGYYGKAVFFDNPDGLMTYDLVAYMLEALVMAMVDKGFTQVRFALM